MATCKPITRFLFAETDPLPEYDAALSEYIFGTNGVHRRARRPGLEAVVPAKPPTGLLKPVECFVRLSAPRVPVHLVRKMLDEARRQCNRTNSVRKCCEFVETLFFFLWNDSESNWSLHVPPQDQTRWSVRATDTSADSAYVNALIEVHSHHWERAFFSREDNLDEVGFRIYGVLGRIFSHPELKVRVSVYGDWWELPAGQIFELPEEVCERYGE